MCTVCGCSEGETRLEGHTHPHEHDYQTEHGQHHTHAYRMVVDHPFPSRPGLTHLPGLSPSRMVQVERDILSKNAEYAETNRMRFATQGTLALNLVSSPGSGKTTLLVETLKQLLGRFPLGVIEGDQQTTRDADRIRATGASAIQVNTGKGCHLDAHMVGHALDRLDLVDQGVLFIENVGNLVCPAAFDLGEAHKVVILSTTEGEDKPLKYPDMFHAANLMVINKTDLLPYVDFNVNRCVEYVLRIHPSIEILQMSARTGEGLDAWLAWIEAERETMLRSKMVTL